jgi:hypothetical protein
VLRRRSTRALVALGIVTAALIGAGTASAADSLQIAGQTATPEQGVPLTLALAGTADAIDNYGDGPILKAIARPAGGLPCQASYESDQAAAGGVNQDLFGDWPQVGPGSFTEATTFNPNGVGPYLVCAWLEDGNHAVQDGPISASFTARGPQVAELNVALASPTLPGVGYQIDYTTQTDQQLSLYSIVKPAGGLPCASSFELEQDQNQSESDVFGGSTSVFGGPTTTTATDTEDTAGAYLICTWIEGPSQGEVDAAVSTPIHIGRLPAPTPKPKPKPKKIGLTPTTELAAFLHWISSRYPAAHGYWTCPKAQIIARQGWCQAQVKVGRLWHGMSADPRLSGARIALRYKSDRSWRRHWSRFSHRVIRGVGTPGTASVNGPDYDWSWLAAQARDGWRHQRRSFLALAYDGNSAGFAHFFKFRCRTRRGLVICTNALGDSMRYRP